MDPEGTAGRVLEKVTRRCRREGYEDPRGLGMDSWIPGAGGLSLWVWGANGLFGGSSLPRPGEGQRGAVAPALGWVWRLIGGTLPGARLGPHRLHPVLGLLRCGQGQQWRSVEGPTLRHLRVLGTEENPR